ncbi:hypothetical protein AB0A76_32860 [Streptomyces exfoliatus]|uniref:Uncharacterized protein n=1 Tax=Streptomyces exfoliatus TaxID=1905 RepID=A0ABV3D6B5_STREX
MSSDRGVSGVAGRFGVLEVVVAAVEDDEVLDAAGAVDLVVVADAEVYGTQPAVLAEGVQERWGAYQ